MIKRKKGNIVTMRSPGYNWDMDMSTGFFARYGNTYKDDPTFSPIGPEILDIEINTDCCGIHGAPCSWCYKSNITTGKYMNFETFVKVVERINPYKNLTQIALGVGNVDGNPDFVKILKWCRDNNIVPNITVNGARLHNVYEGLTYAQWIAKYCGAVAVSVYDDRDAAYDSVYKLTSRGMKQVNIHLMISLETYFNTAQVLEDCATDPRLKDLNAVVFLSLKKKGRGENHHIISQKQFDPLVTLALKNNLRVGFDSCSSYKVFNTFKGTEEFSHVRDSIISCEACLESCYVNVKGQFFPCSFVEGVEGWHQGIDLLSVDSFITEVWNDAKTTNFRNALLATTTSDAGCPCRVCPYYEV